MIWLATGLLLATGFDAWPAPVQRAECHDEYYGKFFAEVPTDSSEPIPVSTDDVPAIFPIGAFEGFTCTQYSHHLHAVGEQALELPEVGQTVRFTWLRTFDQPMVFRATLGQAGPVTLIWKRNSGLGGYAPGVLEASGEIPLTAEDVAAILDAVAAADVCGAPADEASGNDGSSWVFELAEPQRYCLHAAWTPYRGDFFTLGDMLISLSGVEVGDRY